MYDNNPYDNPEKFGLEIIGTLDEDLSWEFNTVVVWQNKKGTLYYAHDSGCSCPSPFEDYNKIKDLTRLTNTKTGWKKFEHMIDNFSYEPTDSIKVDSVRLKAKVSKLLSK